MESVNEPTETFEDWSDKRGYADGYTVRDDCEAYCPACEIAYERGDAEDAGWQCHCGGTIKEN